MLARGIPLPSKDGRKPESAKPVILKTKDYSPRLTGDYAAVCALQGAARRWPAAHWGRSPHLKRVSLTGSHGPSR